MQKDIVFESLDNVVIIERDKETEGECNTKTRCKNKKASKNKSISIKNDNNTEEVDKNNTELNNNMLSNKEVKQMSIDLTALNKKPEFIEAVSETIKKNKELEETELSKLDRNLPYIKNNLLTSAEKQLFHFMNENLFLKERILIFPKVRLGDLVELDTRLEKDMKAYYKVAYKHVDYVIVDKDSLEVICVVELDDYTHDNDKAKQRDQFVYFVLQRVGIQMFRVKSLIKNISKKDLQDIDDIIALYYKPKCYWCGGESRVQHVNRFGSRHRFYGCTNFPVCRWTLDCD